MTRPPGIEAPRLHPIAPIRRPPNITKIGAVVINTAHHPQRPPLRNRLMPFPIIKPCRRRHHKIPSRPIRRPPNLISYHIQIALVTAANHPQTALMRNHLMPKTVPIKARRSRHQNPTRPIRRPPNIRAFIDWRKPITPHHPQTAAVRNRLMIVSPPKRIPYLRHLLPIRSIPRNPNITKISAEVFFVFAPNHPQTPAMQNQLMILPRRKTGVSGDLRPNFPIRRPPDIRPRGHIVVAIVKIAADEIHRPRNILRRRLQNPQIQRKPRHPDIIRHRKHRLIPPRRQIHDLRHHPVLAHLHRRRPETRE